MGLLERLAANRGTVSSALGKQLAAKVLSGDEALLAEAIPLVCHRAGDKQGKNVRSGAAKIVERVAEGKPGLVAPHLESLMPALGVGEPQTRWMTIRTMGFCAALAPDIAGKALAFAKRYIREKVDGQLCLVAAADMYLGDYGATSKKAASQAFPILLESTDNAISNEHDWILEAFIKIARHLSRKEKAAVLDFAAAYAQHPRKATRQRVARLKDACDTTVELGAK